VRQIAPAIGRVSRGVADVGGPRIIECCGNGLAQTVALGQSGALVERSHAARIGAGERVAEHEACDTVGIARHVDERLHGGGGDRDEMIGWRQRAPLQHGLEILDQNFGGDIPYLSVSRSRAGRSAARGALAQRGKDPVPAVEGAAHLVQQPRPTARCRQARNEC